MHMRISYLFGDVLMEIFRRRDANGGGAKSSTQGGSTAEHIDISRNGTTSVSSSTLMDIAQRHFREISTDESVETEQQQSTGTK